VSCFLPVICFVWIASSNVSLRATDDEPTFGPVRHAPPRHGPAPRRGVGRRKSSRVSVGRALDALAESGVPFVGKTRVLFFVDHGRERRRNAQGTERPGVLFRFEEEHHGSFRMMFWADATKSTSSSATCELLRLLQSELAWYVSLCFLPMARHLLLRTALLEIDASALQLRRAVQQVFMITMPSRLNAFRSIAPYSFPKKV